jgi:hypothetical protein
MISIQCKEHPTYKAIRQPQKACLACWFLWKLVSDGTANVYGYPLVVVAKEKK